MDTNIKVKNKSIQKAVEVLNCFTKHPQLRVTEISETLGLYKSVWPVMLVPTSRQPADHV